LRQLGNCYGDVPAPISKSRCRYPVAAVGARRAAFAVISATEGIGFGAHQRLDKDRQQAAQQIRARRRELIGQQLLNVDMLG